MDSTNLNDTDGFADALAGNMRQCAIDTLNKTMLFDGILDTRKNAIRMFVKDGATIVSAADGRRLQCEDESYLPEAIITKTGMDYARHLINKK